MKQITPNELREKIESICGPINWAKMERDMTGVRKAAVAEAAAATALKLLTDCGDFLEFQEIYEHTAISDIDLYLGLSLLVQRGEVVGPHPYTVENNWSHSCRYKAAKDGICGFCGQTISECYDRTTCEWNSTQTAHRCYLISDLRHGKSEDCACSQPHHPCVTLSWEPGEEKDCETCINMAKQDIDTWREWQEKYGCLTNK